jgi:hypothetical protein
MPYTKESTILSTGDGFVISYQRLSTPVVEDRDYTLKILDESREDAAGKVVWKNRWTSSNAGPAPRAGVTRVAVNEGYWQLEDHNSGGTKVTYYVYTNPGGGIPSFVINTANTQAVSELFKAVAKASKDPRYAQKKPAPRTSEKKPEAPAPTHERPGRCDHVETQERFRRHRRRGRRRQCQPRGPWGLGCSRQRRRRRRGVCGQEPHPAAPDDLRRPRRRDDRPDPRAGDRRQDAGRARLTSTTQTMTNTNAGSSAGVLFLEAAIGATVVRACAPSRRVR